MSEINKAFIMSGASDTYATAATYNLAAALASTVIGVYKEDGATRPIQTSTVNLATDYKIVMGTTEGANIESMVIPLDATVSKQSPVAAVAPIKALGAQATGTSTYSLNLPTSLTVGTDYGVNMYDLSLPIGDMNYMKFYSIPVKSGDLSTGTTSVNIITKLVELINADSDKLATAVAIVTGGDNVGIKFTGTAGKDFAVEGTGILSSADKVSAHIVNGAWVSSAVSGMVDVVYPIGAASQMLEVESWSNIHRGYRGRTASSHLDTFTAVSRVIPGVTYTTWTISFRAPAQRPVIQTIQPETVFVIAVNAANTALTTIIDKVLRIT